MSDTLFGKYYDMLLKDVESNESESTKLEEDEIFNEFFSDQHKKALVSPSLLPRVIQWSPQQGQASGMMTIVLRYDREIHCNIRIMFGQLSVETAQHHHRMQHEDSSTVWITLMASIPLIKETQSEGEQVPISITLIDLEHLERVPRSMQIGFFTYTEGVRSNGRKRALSCEPDECPNKKNTFGTKKSAQDEVDDQLLKLLAPYDPILNTSMTTQGNWVSTPTPPPPALSNSSTSSSHELSTWSMDDLSSHAQPNYTTTPSAPLSYPSYPTTGHQGLMSESFPQNTPTSMYDLVSNPINPPSLDTILSKENMYHAFIEMQQRQQFKLNQVSSSMMPQPVNNYMNPFNYHPNYLLQNMMQRQYHQQQQQYSSQRQRQFSLSDTTPQSARPPMLDIQRRASVSAQPMHTVSNTNNISHNGPALNKAHLKLNGDLAEMMTNWNMQEWQLSRRLVHFWRETTYNAEGNLTMVECGFEPMNQHTYHQQRMRDNVAAVAAAAAAAAAVSNSPSGVSSLTHSDFGNSSRPDTNTSPIVISCIYWRERNDYYITSVDCIYLLESIIGIHFTVEEKNRIRRNLEGFRPLTVSKCKSDCAEFFKLIMSFPHPKPRNIEKDVKVFSWRTLPHALKKIIRKYTPSYITTAPLEPIHQRPTHVSIDNQHTFGSSNNPSSSPQNNLGF
ncbi:hypothetical protein A0J61_03828 [Choanephora cucurbitarum]|uniref:DUF7082 domain-containing protein n=1 Tax=Choanephora cucurbitarum TaxID=101091 RepID=A0A1C7NGG1_9FUNG|nr:hypothetical protein A0J61_03828 [Choanephora cucurbitarum]